jgi:hypothetical protein
MAAFIEAFLIFIFYSTPYTVTLAMARATALRGVTSKMFNVMRVIAVASGMVWVEKVSS